LVLQRTDRGNPRKQTISQLFGVLAGTLVCVPVYLVIAVPEKLGTEELPAEHTVVFQALIAALELGDALFCGAPRRHRVQIKTGE